MTDALGSTIALTDSTGALQTQYTYEPFSNTTISGPGNANPYQYTGRENDGTGLYYYRARYYSPIYQRFISEDPLRFAGGINFYAYAGNDPVDFRDPLGLKPPNGPGSGVPGDAPGSPNRPPGAPNPWGPPDSWGPPNPWGPPGSRNPSWPWPGDPNADAQFWHDMFQGFHQLEEPLYPILIGGGMMVAGGGTALTALAPAVAMPATIPVALPVFAGGAWMFYEELYYAWNGTMWAPAGW